MIPKVGAVYLTFRRFRNLLRSCKSCRHTGDLSRALEVLNQMRKVVRDSMAGAGRGSPGCWRVFLGAGCLSDLGSCI